MFLQKNIKQHCLDRALWHVVFYQKQSICIYNGDELMSPNDLLPNQHFGINNVYKSVQYYCLQSEGKVSYYVFFFLWFA